jgi:hypothetical protein
VDDSLAIPVHGIPSTPPLEARNLEEDIQERVTILKLPSQPAPDTMDVSYEVNGG